MIRKVIAPVFAFAVLGLGFSFNGCSCHAEMGDQTAKAPPPPEPVAPAPAPAPAPEPEPPKVEKFHAVGKATIEGDQVKIPGQLEFDVDKATLRETPQSKEILTTLVEFLKQNANVTKLRIEGHTDNSGKPAHNQKLSDDRAASVAKWLTDKGTIDKTRLKTIGFGDTKPAGPNDTPENKQKNRRTEFHVEEIDGKPLAASDTASSGTAPAASGSATPATSSSASAATSASAAPTSSSSATPAAGKGLGGGMHGAGAGKK
jgi:OmpA-OmpF porin, OOP family